MSITDELRRVAAKTECANGRCEKLYRGDLDHIANRIDQEHEECAGFCRRLEDAASKGEEVTLFGTDYVPLPKDADGETIHLGDELEWLDGNRLTVNGIGEGGTLFYVDAQGDAQWTAPGDKRHVQHDSWERIIRDATALGAQVKRRTYQIGDFVERCKKLAGEE